jgi:hypothetical protein
MPSPTGYSESSFVEYLRDEVLLATADVLGWTGSSALTKPWRGPVRRALRLCGVADMTSADVGKLEAMGRIAVWEAVSAEVMTAINYEADEARYDREALFAHAQKQLADARTEARKAGYLSRDPIISYHADIQAVY